MNNQLPEKRIQYADTLQVHSVFHTIQGEGPFAGRPALFVRLAGCNLQCPACDTDYTSEREVFTHARLIAHIRLSLQGKKLVVITGGEPFRQPIAEVVNALLRHGIQVQIETNGTLYTSTLCYGDPLLTIVCSPKTATVSKPLLPNIDAFKYVLKHGQVGIDGLPIKALDHPCASEVSRPPSNFRKERIYVQPLDEGNHLLNRLNMTTTIKSSLKHGYTLCLQLHKYADLP